jgi:hypothetical protein
MLEAKIQDDDPNAAKTRQVRRKTNKTKQKEIWFERKVIKVIARCVAHLQPHVGAETSWSTGDYIAAGVLAASSIWLINRKIFSRL